jgi:hypothetical protein
MLPGVCNQVADATRIPCGEGVFWLAAVRDAFSNRIVGWRCSDRCDTGWVKQAEQPCASSAAAAQRLLRTEAPIGYTP